MCKDYKQVLRELIETASPSGHEGNIAKRIMAELQRFTSDVRQDALGNVIACIRGSSSSEDMRKPKVLLAAHMDEIGLMVSKIETGGFLRVTQLGGFDPRTLLGQEVVVHGKRQFSGVIGSKPPHLSAQKEREQAILLTDVFIDLGVSEALVRECVAIGDLVTIARQAVPLLGDRMAGKSLDNRSSIVAVLECLQELQRLQVQADVYAVATVQEEVTMVGAFAGTFGIRPDLGIAVDVCHAAMPGVAKDLTAELHGGPAIAFGPNIHGKVFRRLIDTAQKQRIPFQIRTTQGPTPTDARAIQITAEGHATGLVSIPLRYMHTSVEVIDYRDVQLAGVLLASFIASCDKAFVEGLTCYLDS
ncbi:M42 family peptidase [Fodinisporobacter ferrooxydans]|uniref:M42 family peptidase n=1 Tax=Fodinisporobacter ferrooxydans TaxID=2901836 RepID=A0ABY4CGW0_9BACL|nr:M42 family peptidase [Alicyclobacillaceae bacterium MYW30-H2]